MKAVTQYKNGNIAKCSLLITCGILCIAGAMGQNGGSGKSQVPCMVNKLRLRIATGADDLRGWDGVSTSKDNLDVTIYFGDHGSQLAADVNQDNDWQNNSVHIVEIKLNSAVPVNEIKGIKLQHTGSGIGISSMAATGVPGTGIQTADNWDMNWIEVAAEGDGTRAVIARNGAKRFTGEDRVLSIRTVIPANSCQLSQRPGKMNAVTGSIHLGNGAGSKYGTQKSAPSAIQAVASTNGQLFQNNRLIQQALAHTVQIGPRASGAGTGGSYAAITALLKRQSAAAHSLLVPAVRPVSSSNSGPLLSGGTAQMLNPQPYPPKGSSSQIGAGQTMSASAVPTGMNAGSAMSSNMQSGPSAHRAPKPQSVSGTAPVPAQLCKPGIATVDGGTVGVWFSPVPGPDGTFVLQGCGFGTTLGQVYLSGVKYAPVPPGSATQVLPGALQHPDRVSFQVSPNTWSDRQIVAQIDPNAGGLYDTNNVTLVVTTAAGQSYQAPGMNFLAARVPQVLAALPKRTGCTPHSTGPACIPVGVSLVSTTSSSGAVVPDVESPSQSLLRPGATIAVARESATGQFPIPMTPGISFRGGLDSYQFSFAPGFQLDTQNGVLLRHATVDVNSCQSMNGVYSTSGNWSVKYTSPSSFEIYWGEEGCWPKAAISGGNSLDVLNYASLSAYELDITVVGPRGISPWPGGNVNPLAIKPQAQGSLLMAH